MKTTIKRKTFDCVKMKNDIQATIHAETQNMTVAELLAYFNRPSEDNDAPPAIPGWANRSKRH